MYICRCWWRLVVIVSLYSKIPLHVLDTRTDLTRGPTGHVLTFDLDNQLPSPLDLQFQATKACYGHDPYTHAIDQVKGQSVQKTVWKQADGQTWTKYLSSSQRYDVKCFLCYSERGICRITMRRCLERVVKLGERAVTGSRQARAPICCWYQLSDCMRCS